MKRRIYDHLSFVRTRSHEDSRRASCRHVGCTVSSSNHQRSTSALNLCAFSIFTPSLCSSPLAIHHSDTYYPAITYTVSASHSRHVEISFPLLICAQRHGAALLSRGRLAGKSRLGLVCVPNLSTAHAGQRGETRRDQRTPGKPERARAWSFVRPRVFVCVTVNLDCVYRCGRTFVRMYEVLYS
jgi:hypothetical protein